MAALFAPNSNTTPIAAPVKNAPVPNAAKVATDLLNPNPQQSLQSWFALPTAGHVPLSQVSFGPLDMSQPTPAPQYPDPTGVRGNNVAFFNKLAKWPPIQRVISGATAISRF